MSILLNQLSNSNIDRLSLNDDDKKVREWFISEVKSLGCQVKVSTSLPPSPSPSPSPHSTTPTDSKVDQIGSIFATRPGKNNTLPPIGIGSHLDTQPKGGRYDGILGVNSALEVLRTIHENNYETYAPLCIIDWTNEEGARFPPAMMAS